MEEVVYNKEEAMIMWHSKHDIIEPMNFLPFLKECYHFKASFKKAVVKGI